MKKFVLISDTHNQLAEISHKLPHADILIISGDLTEQGLKPEVKMLSDHLSSIKNKYKHIVVIPGNHDFLAEEEPKVFRDLISPHCTILINEGIEIEGIKIWGSPWTPWFYSWAFNFPQYDGGLMAKQTWAKIPEDTNILITHGPAKDILDLTPRKERVGCPHLRLRIQELKQLKLHVFGHIHSGYGTQNVDGIVHVNASTCNENYEPVNKPIELVIE